jgi:hypothetical protein
MTGVWRPWRGRAGRSVLTPWASQPAGGGGREALAALGVPGLIPGRAPSAQNDSPCPQGMSTGEAVAATSASSPPWPGGSSIPPGSGSAVCTAGTPAVAAARRQRPSASGRQAACPPRPGFLVRNRVIASSLGVQNGHFMLSNSRRWSCACVLSGRCATPVVGPSASAISRTGRRLPWQARRPPLMFTACRDQARRAGLV